MSLRTGAVLSLAVMLTTFGAAKTSTPHYVVEYRYRVGGEGGWDYLTVDPSSHRLFISRGSHVMVFNPVSGKVVGDIPDTPGVHGIALVPKLGKGYTSNGRDGSVTVFDLKSLRILTRIKVGQNPDAIIYDPAANRVITCNGRSEDISVIDPTKDETIGTIKVSGKPEFAVADGQGGVFVNIEDKSVIESLDLVGMKSTASWPLAPGDGPSGLAIDIRHHLLFSTCGNNILAVVDTRTGKLVATPKIGNGPDAAAFDPALNLAFSSNGQDGTISVIGRNSKGKYEPVTEIATAKGARTMTLDPKTHKIYLVTADFGMAEPGSRRPPMVKGSFQILVVSPQ